MNSCLDVSFGVFWMTLLSEDSDLMLTARIFGCDCFEL